MFRVVGSGGDRVEVDLVADEGEVLGPEEDQGGRE
jgi:hypothetical protein